MCKSRDPFFYTGVIVRARCARYYQVPTNHLLELPRIDVHAAFHLVRVLGDIDVLLSDQNVVNFMFPPHPWVRGILCQVVNPCHEL